MTIISLKGVGFTASVKLEKVNKIFGGRVHVLKDITLEVKNQEFLVLVGPSGCGKTTVLRLIAGLEEPTAGNIFIDDRRVNDVQPKDRDIAMIFQNYALYPHMNVYENMAFGLKLHGIPKSETQKRIENAANLLKIQNFLGRKPSELSGGERQRVAMGRAIVREPRVFLMDEPLSNLDAKLRAKMRMELQKLHRRLGVTTIYVTHDQVEAMTLGSRLGVMHDGCIQQIDSALNLYRFPVNLFVAGFIGSPSMNFLSARVKEKQNGLFLGGEGFEVKISPEKVGAVQSYKEREIILGIRPEAISLQSDNLVTAPENVVTGSLEAIEFIGAEAFLHVTVGAISLVMKANKEFTAPLGTKLPIVFDMNQTHFFDPQTTCAL